MQILSAQTLQLLLKIAFRNVFLHFRRSVAAVIAIASAFTSLLLFEGYMAETKAMYVATYSQRQMLGDLLVERANLLSPGKASADENGLTLAEQSAIESYLRANFAVFSRFLNVSGFVGNGEASVVFAGIGYDLTQGGSLRGDKYYWNTYAGVPLEGSAENSIVMARTLAELLGCRGADNSSQLNGVVGYSPQDRPFSCTPSKALQLQAATEKAQANALDVNVTGLMATGFADLDERLLYLPLQLAQKLLDTVKVSYYTVKLQPGADVSLFSAKMQKHLGAQGLNIAVGSWKDHVFGDLFVRTVDFLNIFRTFIVTIIILIASMVVVSTYMKIVRERTKEIGTLRSVGYRVNQIVSIFLLEAVQLALVGWLLGALISVGLSELLSSMGITYKAGFLSDPVPFLLKPPLWDYFFYGLAMFVLSVLASIVASFKRAKMQISDALLDN